MKKTSWFQRLLWSVAGAEVAILEQDDCRTDHKKYSAVGAAILVTTFWAFCSGALAAWFFTQKAIPIQDEQGKVVVGNNTNTSYNANDTVLINSVVSNPDGTSYNAKDTILATSITENANNSKKAFEKSKGSLGAALIFGTIWAILIFCIDRCLVITLKKDPTLKKQKWAWPFSIRCVLAIIIAFMMSIPLEIFVFRDFIEVMSPDYDEMHVKEFGEGTKAGEMSNNLAIEIGKGRNDLDRLYTRDSTEKEKINETYSNLINWEVKKTNPRNSPRYVKADDKYQELLRPYLRDTNYYRNGRWLKYPQSKEYNDVVFERKKAKEDWEYNCDIKIDSLKNEYSKDTAQNNSTTKRISNTQDKLNRDDQNKADVDKELWNKQNDKELRLKKANHFIRNFEILNWAILPSNNSGNWWDLIIVNLIRLIFFIVELLPTVVKIWTSVGNYDRKIYAEEQQLMVYLASPEYANAMKRMHNIAVETQEQILKKQQEAEVELKSEILQHLKEAQVALAKKSIDKWTREENDKLDKMSSAVCETDDDSFISMA